MKKLLHLFSIASIVSMISCTSGVSTIEIIDEEEPPKTASILDIEFNTLDEINSALVQMEIDPFTENELESRRSAQDERSCLNAKFKGDLNEDQVISISDVLKIFELINEYDNTELYPEIANGDGRLDVVKEYSGTSPSFWAVVNVGKLVTYDESGSSDTVLDRYDATIIIDLIIQHCN